MVRWAAWSCPHNPITHEHSFRRFLQTVRDFKPHQIICLGDLLDGSPASRFPTEDDWTLADEFDAAGQHLARVRTAAEEAANGAYDVKCTWLEGNHDYNVTATNRLPRRLRDLCNWRNNPATLLSKEIDAGSWRVVPYSHRQLVRLGQVVFQHGAECGVNAGRNLATLYAPENGLLVFGHTHRPVQPTQAMVTSKIPVKKWFANAGCMVDWDKLAYIYATNISTWGHGCVIGEVQVGRNVLGKNWDAETIIYRMAH